MISLDYRTGSKELEPIFKEYGIQVQVCTLPYGDIAFEGNGPKGKTAVVIERKQIGELVQSIQSKRLSGHQLPGMADMYDYCYLIVEGLWRPSDTGALQVGYGHSGEVSWGGRWQGVYGSRPMSYRAVDNYLSTLELHAGVIFRRTFDAVETVAVIVDLYHWWRDKEWLEHSSHLGVYAPAVAKQGKSRLNLAQRKITLAEKWALQLPGIGMKAQEIIHHFGTARAMANAELEEWVKLPGIGKPTAKKIVGEINAQV